MVRIFLLIVALLGLNTTAFADTIQFDGMTIQRGNETVITDSMVRNLSCQRINPRNIFTALQPDAFGTAHHIPVKNWTANGLGQCWAMGLTQRDYFYLLRFGARTNPANKNNDLFYMLGLARGKYPFPYSLQRKVIGLGETWPTTFSELQAHGFKQQVEGREIDRFYDATNLDLVVGNRERFPFSDFQTMQQISWDLARGRMPLIILRAARDIQHVVLVKSMQKIGPETFMLNVYDSNHPDYDNTMIYQDRRFYAPKILLGMVGDINSPVGVFLRDEDQMDLLQSVVYRHYASVCASLSARSAH